MDSYEFFKNVHHQINDAFVSQDPELFDLVFEIEGKKLYAEKLRLSVISPTLKTMLSDRWNSKNTETVKITGYSFDNFKEFISCLYSGKCHLSQENIFTMVDIAEFFQVPFVKNLCDEYLSKMKLTYNNVFEVLEMSKKYSLIKLESSIKNYVSTTKFFESEEFLNAEKSNIYDLITLKPTQEKMFEAVYLWSENQVIKSGKVLNINEENDAIKSVMSEFLPHLDYKKMKRSFLMKSVAEYAFVFSDDEFNDISRCLNSKVKVKITNIYGQSMIGFLSYDKNETEIEEIKSLKNPNSERVDAWKDYDIRWKTNLLYHKPKNSIKKKSGVKWYFCYFMNGYFGVKLASNVSDYYDVLLTEMIVDDSRVDFNLVESKIELE